MPEKAIPCEFAPLFYEINKRTDEGKKEVFIHDEEDKELVHPYYEQADRQAKQLKVSKLAAKVAINDNGGDLMESDDS